MNYDELGKKIKEKYPQYKDSSDFDVGVSASKKYPQYQSVITDDRKAITSKERKAKIAGFQAEDAGLQAEAKQKGSFGSLFKETFKPTSLAKATFEVGLGTLAKFGASAIEAPGAAITGKASQRTYDLPGLAPFKSFQSEAETRAGKIIEGEKPLYTAISPFIEVPLAGVEALFVGKGLTKLAKQVPKGVSKLSDIRSAKSVRKLAQDVFTPKTPKEKISSLQKSGGPGGFEQTGISKTIGYTPTKQDIETAKIVKNAVGSKTGSIQRASKINETIEDISKGVESFLSKAKVNPKYTSKDLTRAIDNIKPSIDVKSEESTMKLFNEMKRMVKDDIFEAGENSSKLWRSRIKTDEKMKRVFSNIFETPRYTPTKDAYLQMRNSINKFIEVRTVGGDAGFTKKMRELTSLYEANLKLAERNYKILGTTAFKRWLQMHPNVRKALWFGGTSVIGGAVGAGGVSLLNQ